MDIFKGLFRNFFRSNQPGRNYEDKTPFCGGIECYCIAKKVY